MKRLLLALLLCSPVFAGYSQYWTIVAPANPTADTLASGTYTSGITAVGTTSQTCTLTLFNGGGSGATATVALTGTNAIAGGTALVITAAGTGYTSAPTSATAGSGTATCTGTATVSTVVTGADLTNYPVLIDNTRYAVLGTAFKTTGNGGLLTSSSGYDHVYTTTLPTGGPGNYSCTVNMDWDQSVWAANGPFVDFVLLATLSHTTTTTFYACAGNSSITTFQGNTAGTWSGAVWTGGGNGFSQILHLSESSNPYNDSTGNGFNSSAGTYPTRVTGSFGFAQSFVAGSSQYIQTTNSVSTGSFGTFSGWFKTSTTPASSGVILDMRGNGSQNGVVMYLNTTSGFASSYCNTGSVNGSTNLADGNWHYLVTVKTQLNPELAGFYVDGTSLGSTNPCSGFSSGTEKIGASTDASPVYFTAVIQEIRTSAGTASSSWVAADYNSQKPSSTFLTVTAALGFVANPWVIVVN